ncbi:MAG: hypothetical protein BRD57_02165, partial [Proteobacteria bacterium SW_6_67_9]
MGDRALPRALLPAAAGLALVGGIVWARPGALVVAGVATWLPAYLGARVLRQRGRLDDPLLVACGLGWGSVVVLHWVVPDVTAAWRDMLQQIVPAEETADGTALTAAQIRSSLDAVAPLMTAALGASVTLGAIASVVLGRWWQAVLDAPGSFQRAFHDLRMGQVAAVVTAALVAAAFATPVALVRGLAAAAGGTGGLWQRVTVHLVGATTGQRPSWWSAGRPAV